MFAASVGVSMLASTAAPDALVIWGPASMAVACTVASGTDPRPASMAVTCAVAPGPGPRPASIGCEVASDSVVCTVALWTRKSSGVSEGQVPPLSVVCELHPIRTIVLAWSAPYNKKAPCQKRHGEYDDRRRLRWMDIASSVSDGRTVRFGLSAKPKAPAAVFLLWSLGSPQSASRPMDVRPV